MLLHVSSCTKKIVWLFTPGAHVFICLLEGGVKKSGQLKLQENNRERGRKIERVCEHALDISPFIRIRSFVSYVIGRVYSRLSECFLARFACVVWRK